MKDIMETNVVILPPQEIIQEAVDLSRKVDQNFDVFFRLDSGICIPHISLYHAAYPSHNLVRVQQEVEAIAKETDTFFVELGDAAWNLKGGWIDFPAAKSQALLNLHRSVVERLNPLREGALIARYETDFHSYSPEEQESMQKYGSPHDVALFHPHLTITRIKSGDTESAAKLLAGTNLSFYADTLAFCELGDYGTCTKVLGSWPLKKK